MDNAALLLPGGSTVSQEKLLTRPYFHGESNEGAMGVDLQRLRLFGDGFVARELRAGQNGNL